MTVQVTFQDIRPVSGLVAHTKVAQIRIEKIRLHVFGTFKLLWGWKRKQIWVTYERKKNGFEPLFFCSLSIRGLKPQLHVVTHTAPHVKCKIVGINSS